MEFERKRIRPPELKLGVPLLQEELVPFALAHARTLHSRDGHLLHGAFERWELGFLRGRNPNQALANWEVITRAFESFVEDHPGCNRQDVIELAYIVSAGPEDNESSADYTEVRSIFRRERDKLPPRLREARPLTEEELARLLDAD